VRAAQCRHCCCTDARQTRPSTRTPSRPTSMAMRASAMGVRLCAARLGLRHRDHNIQKKEKPRLCSARPLRRCGLWRVTAGALPFWPRGLGLFEGGLSLAAAPLRRKRNASSRVQHIVLRLLVACLLTRGTQRRRRRGRRQRWRWRWRWRW
jgi:hypothetical protein